MTVSTATSDAGAHPPSAKPAPGPSTGTAAGDWAFCVEALPQVSRTFALCIRLLPPGLERSVTIAYLLCRIADTIEDAEAFTVDTKRHLLDQFATTVEHESDETGYLRDAFPEDGTAEDRLCFHSDRVMRSYARLSAEEHAAIAPWVVEMCRGMGQFSRGADSTDDGLPSLETLEDLDRYCYYVAGTVGHLLTGLFGLRFPGDRARLDRLEADATSFGLGLQLTNIIKDAAQDHRRGWSFIPRDVCEREGIDVAGLFGPGHAEASRRVFDVLIAKARGHLDDALRYTMTLPATQYRIRLFCLTSLFFAVRTLRLAAARDGGLVEGGTVKITRGEVYRLLGMTMLIAPSNALIRRYYRRLSTR